MINRLWKRLKQWACNVGLCNLDKCNCRYSGRSAAWNERKAEVKNEPLKIRPTVIPNLVECTGRRTGAGGTTLPCGEIIEARAAKCPHCGTLRKTSAA